LDVVALGETMGLVAFNDTGPMRVGSVGRLSIGGAESNVAIALARLGHRAAWIGRVGSDMLGRLVESTLLAERVDVTGLSRDPELPTGCMLREHRTYDRFRVDYYRKGLAGSRLAPEHVPADVIARTRAVHVTGITPAVSDVAGGAARHAIDLGRETGALISFDVNHRSALWGPEQARPVLREFVQASDVVFAGPEEAELVTGLPAGGPGEPVAVAALARALGELGPREVVVKCGEFGATAWTADGDTVKSIPARRVTCIDPVGAGDAFVAGYLSALLDGDDLAERLDRGTACGAFAVSVSGDWEGAPRRDELGFVGSGDNVLR
jgi:2-dehydro-3-deoxygluconokinase